MNFAIETTKSKDFNSIFNDAFNIALNNGYKWLSVIDKDDSVEQNWVYNFDKYSKEMDNISVFFPIVRQVSAGNMTGHLNEATWLEGRSEVAGQADLQMLMSWNCLSPTGCMINLEDVKEYSEERDGMYYPFKENMNIASSYEFYLRTSRLDLDDYNHEVEEGLHTTSMAGTWMSIVEGFGGMRVLNNTLSFSPKIPKGWKAYSFKVNFRHQVITVNVSQTGTEFTLEGKEAIDILVDGKQVIVSPSK